MTDVQDRLERAAQWQRSRRALSWADKIRLAEAIRDSIVKLRRTRPDASPASSAQSANDSSSAVQRSND
jgi:hypothetical protein